MRQVFALSKPLSRRSTKPHPLLPRHGEFVHVAGRITKVLVETSDRLEKVDHLWIDVDASIGLPLRVSLSTYSRQSRAAGFDPRIWLGSLRSVWSELPAPGIQSTTPLNYAEIEANQPLAFMPFERVSLEKHLVEKASRALFAEAWGELYVRGHAGVHQIHSRRASFAVPFDLVGQDGAVQFYYPENAEREMLLFKFAGQP